MADDFLLIFKRRVDMYDSGSKLSVIARQLIKDNSKAFVWVCLSRCWDLSIRSWAWQSKYNERLWLAMTSHSISARFGHWPFRKQNRTDEWGVYKNRDCCNKCGSEILLEGAGKRYYFENYKRLLTKKAMFSVISACNLFKFHTSHRRFIFLLWGAASLVHVRGEQYWDWPAVLDELYQSLKHY